jgi:glycosyltransferase involved in cell wall biosynthesis
VQEAFEMAKLFVAIATVGRAELVRRTVDLLADQTRVADGVLVTTVTPADAAGVEQARGRPEIVFGERGLCRQRNRALHALAGRADIVVFLDDDFVAAPDFLANIERLFEEMPDVAGITGDLIADGIHGDGYTIEQAQALIAERARLERCGRPQLNRHSRESGNLTPDP